MLLAVDCLTRDGLHSQDIERVMDKLLTRLFGVTLDRPVFHHCRSLVHDGKNVAVAAVSAQLLGGVLTFDVVIQEVEEEDKDG